MTIYADYASDEQLLLRKSLQSAAVAISAASPEEGPTSSTAFSTSGDSAGSAASAECSFGFSVLNLSSSYRGSRVGSPENQRPQHTDDVHEHNVEDHRLGRRRPHPHRST